MNVTNHRQCLMLKINFYKQVDCWLVVLPLQPMLHTWHLILRDFLSVSLLSGLAENLPQFDGRLDITGLVSRLRTKAVQCSSDEFVLCIVYSAMYYAMIWNMNLIHDYTDITWSTRTLQLIPLCVMLLLIFMKSY